MLQCRSPDRPPKFLKTPLWATEAGMAVTWAPLVWAAASQAKMAIAMPAGVLLQQFGSATAFATAAAATAMAGAVLVGLAGPRSRGSR